MLRPRRDLHGRETRGFHMRALMMLIVVLGLGCSRRVSTTRADAATESDAASGDAGPGHDAVGPMIDTGPARDSGGSARDTGPARDTGSTRDMGTGRDTGPSVMGDTCASAIDISAGGTFMVDTCILNDDVVASCGVTGGRDAVLSGVSPVSGSTYRLTVPSDWVVQQTDVTCGPAPFSCSASGWGVSGATGAARWFFAVEKLDGTCGTVSVVVDRMM